MAATWKPGFGRVPSEEILQRLFVGALGVRGAERVDGEGGDGAVFKPAGNLRERHFNALIWSGVFEALVQEAERDAHEVQIDLLPSGDPR